MPEPYVPLYTDEDIALAERRGAAILTDLDALLASETTEFRHARRAAIEAKRLASWHGRGEWEEMSAALHAALSVLRGTNAADQAPPDSDGSSEIDPSAVEALAKIIERAWGNPTWDGTTLRPVDRQLARAILEAGYREPSVPAVS